MTRLEGHELPKWEIFVLLAFNKILPYNEQFRLFHKRSSTHPKIFYSSVCHNLGFTMPCHIVCDCQTSFPFARWVGLCRSAVVDVCAEFCYTTSKMCVCYECYRVNFVLFEANAIPMYLFVIWTHLTILLYLKVYFVHCHDNQIKPCHFFSSIFVLYGWLCSLFSDAVFCLQKQRKTIFKSGSGKVVLAAIFMWVVSWC
mgnify:CR=1 FL=1